MKTKSAVWAGLIFLFSCLSSGWAQNAAGLEAKIQKYYSQLSACLEAEDLEGVLSLTTDDYQEIYIARDREGSRNLFKSIFASLDDIHMATTALDISQSGQFIKVLREEKISARSGGGELKEISNKTVLDYLIQEGDSLKCARYASVEKDRIRNISGQAYKDADAGFSFIAPAGWEIIPGGHPIPGAVCVLAPDKTSAALLGYVKTPGFSAQQAAEGDETITKGLAKPETYQLVKSGPIKIGSFEGYEIESRFAIPNVQDRYRRRVYFKAHGSLYVLCFDAIPYTQWDSVKDGFQSIMNSFKLSE